MKNNTNQKLIELQINLPTPPQAQGSYVPWVISNNLVFISGQIPIDNNGKLYKKGIVPTQVSVNEAIESAKLCAINILAHLKVACNNDLDRVSKVIKLGGFVACNNSFTEHPKIINGASDLFVSVFGDKAKHARFAIGASSLPLEAPVEVDAIFEII